MLEDGEISASRAADSRQSQKDKDPEILDDSEESQTFDSIYYPAIQKIKSQEVDDAALAQRALSWIACAKRSLSPRELQHAVAIEADTRSLNEDQIPEIEKILSVCEDLIFLDQESDTVRWIQDAAWQYFDRTWPVWFPDAQVEITKACVTYLSFDMLDGLESKPNPENYPLYSYAAGFWSDHAKGTMAESDSLVLKFLIAAMTPSTYIRFVIESDEYLSSRLSDGINTSTAKMTRLQLSIYLGLSTSTSVLLKETPELKSDKGALFLSPLVLAAERGHADIVNILFDNETAIESEAFEIAAERGNNEILRTLFERIGTDVLNDCKENTPGSNMIRSAIQNNHEETVNLLLDQGLNLSSGKAASCTSLAAKLGHTEIAMRLAYNPGKLEDPHSSGARVRPLAFFTAIQDGNEELITRIIEKGIPSREEGKGLSYSIVLLSAAGSGNERIVKMLLDKGLDPETQSHSRTSPLWAAVQSGSEGVVRVLFEAGQPSFGTDDSTLGSAVSRNGDDTPLDSAKDEENTAEQKLDYTKNIVSAAVLRGHDGILRILFQKISNLETVELSKSLLPLAIQHKQEGTVQFLLEKGANPEPEGQDTTPLLQTAKLGLEKAAASLLEHGANIEAEDIDGSTPLFVAIKEGHSKVIDVLLDCGADVERRSSSGETAYEFALRYRNPIAVRSIQARLSLLSTVSSDTDLGPSDSDLEMDDSE